MQKNAKLVPLGSKFNAFHLAVAVHQEECAWILNRLIEDELHSPGIGLLRELNEKLLALIELQDSN